MNEIRDAVLGQAVGDAFGVPVEFMSRRDVRKLHLTEMVGKNTPVEFFSRWSTLIPAGAWSDDTSMMLASMDAFVRCGGHPDYEEHMKRFLAWWDQGEYCCLSFPFGLGNNVGSAMERFRRGTPVLQCGGRGRMDNGNGSLMRILPFSLYSISHQLTEKEMVDVVGKGSAITHGHDISRMSCVIFTVFLKGIIKEKNLESAFGRVADFPWKRYFSQEALDALRDVTSPLAHDLSEGEIGETGYVVDTLKTAFYSLSHSRDYESAVLTAVNLGYDTDTSASVTGALAGVLYGNRSIPKRWMNALLAKDMLEEAAESFTLEMAFFR